MTTNVTFPGVGGIDRIHDGTNIIFLDATVTSSDFVA